MVCGDLGRGTSTEATAHYHSGTFNSTINTEGWRTKCPFYLTLLHRVTNFVTLCLQNSPPVTSRGAGLRAMFLNSLMAARLRTYITGFAGIKTSDRNTSSWCSDCLASA